MVKCLHLGHLGEGFMGIHYTNLVVFLYIEKYVDIKTLKETKVKGLLELTFCQVKAEQMGFLNSFSFIYGTGL